jgi:hypothetical protein
MMPNVRDAVFGNVGSIIAFRMSADDGGVLKKYFEPKFEEHDLIHMHNRHFVVSMTIEGEKIPAFSAISLNLPPQGEDHTAYIIDRSRAQYASSREYVERFMHERYAEENNNNKNQKQQLPPRPKPEPKAAPAKNPLRPTVLAHTALAAEVMAPAALESTVKPAQTAPVPVSPRTSDIEDQVAAEFSEKPKRRRRKRKPRTRASEDTTQAESPRAIESVTPPVSAPLPKPTESAVSTPLETPKPIKSTPMAQQKKPEVTKQSTAPQELESEGVIHLK